MKKSIKYRILGWTLVVIVVLVLVGAGTWLVLMEMGRARLQQNASSRMPVLSDNLNEEEAPEADESWEEDWIRYHGTVYDYNENILTFLCMGIDVNDIVSEEQSGLQSGQADALFLLTLNPDNKQMYIIAIDRNTMTDIDAYNEDGSYAGTRFAQITVAHGYGDGKVKSAENQVKAVSHFMYDLPIHGYCAINMAAIGPINDAVGGVNVTVLEDLTKASSRLKEGEQVHLMGKDAYWYVKYRDITLEESARRRLNRQKQYLVAYIAQAKEAFKSDVTLPITLYNSISKYMTTDITIDEVAYLAGNAAGYTFSEENLITIPGHTDLSGRFEEFYPEEDAVKDIIVEIFYEPLEGIE